MRKIILPSEALIAAYNSGKTLHEVAAQFSLNYMTVWRRLAERGIARRRPGRQDQWADKHPLWKGRNASYACFHSRVERKCGRPKHCTVCGTSDPTKTYDWANLTGRYYDLSDFKRMCRKCHINFDRKKRKD